MNAPLRNISEFYHLPQNMLLQVIHLREDGAECHFTGDEFHEFEAEIVSQAESAFGDLGELSDLGYDALGEFIRQSIDEFDVDETETHYKITAPDGTEYSDISPEVFDMLWDAIYVKRSLTVRGREGNRFRVGVSPSYAAVTIEWGSYGSDLKVIAIAGKNGGDDAIYIKSAKAVRMFLSSRSFELGKLASKTEDKPGSVDFIKSEPRTVKRGLFAALTRKLNDPDK